ncbi:MAG: hypothetical protein H6Q10_3258 [Acidobacteria bacterium]|nr:hypothetical protein [Acidobacteriota bacterium]
MTKPLAALALLALAGCSPPAETPADPASRSPAPQAAVTGGPIVNLPKQAGPWLRPDTWRRVTADTIFDYMDGGGELYLAYRFDHLDVCEYRAADASLGTILVELYWMRSSDDAFGLLSTDWGGEAVRLEAGPPPSPSVPLPQALYGAGLLRLWSGDLYARVLASRESPSSREQVLALGRAILAGREPADAPLLLGEIVMPRGWMADRAVFFRSHLVLNSTYFLASDDILGLGPDVEGLTSELAGPPGTGRGRLIVVRYPSPQRAAAALRTFRQAYLPEEKAPGAAEEGSARTEQGWAAFRQRGRALVIVLDAVSREAGLALVHAQLLE